MPDGWACFQCGAPADIRVWPRPCLLCGSVVVIGNGPGPSGPNIDSFESPAEAHDAIQESIEANRR